MSTFVVDEIEEPKPTERVCRPCELKGSYMGRADCGWRLNGDRRKSSQCELLSAKLCAREFEHPFSIGTINYLKQNPLSNFQGCQSLDQNLFEAKELSLEPNTFEVISDDPLAMSRSRDDGFDSLEIPECNQLLLSPSGAGKWLKWIEELNKKQTDTQNLAYELRSSSDTPLANFLATAPESLEHIHFRNLISKGYFKRVMVRNDRERERLELVADLLVRGFWDIDVIEEIFPGLVIPNFEELKRKIILHVRKNLPQKALRFEKFWINLTHSQQEALWLYYMKNPHNRSQEFVASIIGISLDSFKDRLSGAITKLKVAFQEFSVSKPPRSAVARPEPPPLKVFSKDEVSVFAQTWKPDNKKRNRLKEQFESLDAYYAWEEKTTFYPNSSGTW